MNYKIIIIYFFIENMKYLKILSHRLKIFFKIGHFLGHFIFAHYALKNNYKIKMSRNHSS
jgi:hypothetical protein